ncbi:MAG: alpha/beta hydrolase [Acidimicrobiales bacterium]
MSEPLHPQIVALVSAMDRPDRPLLHELSVADARKVYGAMPRFLGPLDGTATSEDRTIPGPAGEIPIRVYTPDDDTPDDDTPDGDTPDGDTPEGASAGGEGRPVVVFYHGGGFCIGDLDTHDRECRAIAARSGAIVVAVDYRMGPEHAYTADAERPAWIDDAWAAFTWVVDNAASLGGDADRLVVCGDSAGGNISAVVAQMARNADLPLALQVLVYPATDVRDEAYDLYPSYAECIDAPILERPMLEYFRSNSRPDGDPTSPFMSPALNDDLSGLAPAFVLTASHDPLRDDGEAYVERLRAAGVDVVHVRYEGMPHGFFNFGPVVDAANEAVAAVADAIAAV